MAPPMLLIRPIVAADQAAWRGLWDSYCDFYKEAVPEPVSQGLWQRLLDPEQPIGGMLAEAQDGRSVGLMHYVLHPNTWSLQTLGYLEDLYVAADQRGQGIGRALIEALVEKGRAEGWYRVYWHTNTDNANARFLYDKIAGPSAAVKYTIPLGYK